jgi:hypothetical protein
MVMSMARFVNKLQRVGMFLERKQLAVFFAGVIGVELCNNKVIAKKHDNIIRAQC